MYVASTTAKGFSVREAQGGASDLTFSYRIIVKRSDTQVERLAMFALPAARPVPSLPDVLKGSLTTPLQSPSPAPLPAVRPTGGGKPAPAPIAPQPAGPASTGGAAPSPLPPSR
ncbi:MAG: hypothetical protein ACR2JW_07410 [Thermomicrobiales bacterium]